MDAENNNLRVASFAVYLNDSQENFTDKLTQHSVERSSLDFTRRSPISITPVKPKIDHQGNEISVFGAEKYFNMKVGGDASPRMMDYNAWEQGHTNRRKSSQLDYQQQMRMKLSRPQTPSVISSESSWSSQGALFPTNLMRSCSQNKLKKVNEKWYFAGLISCRGSCSTKKANDVDPYVVQAIQSDQYGGRRLSQQRFMVKDEIPCPSFDTMSIGTSTDASSYISMAITSPRVPNKRELAKVEEARSSLEVFGSKDLKRGDIAKNLERKLSMLTWDAIPNAPNICASTVSSLMYEEEAADSEGSSDLFEIEKLSGKPMMLTRQSSDGMSSCISRYEASESSVEWSVVTGSALDYSEYAATVRSPGPGFHASPRNKMGLKPTQREKSSSGGILSCKSQKAIQVAEPQPQRSTSVRNYIPN
ncbi:hypothetical protein ACFE04_009055 [Oxalis oulophora]